MYDRQAASAQKSPETNSQMATLAAFALSPEVNVVELLPRNTLGQKTKT